MTKASLATKVEKLMAKKNVDSMDLFFAAEELREAAEGDEKLLATALKAMRKSAEDNPNAALVAGQMILAGAGTEADIDSALLLFEKGGDGGNWDAALAAAKLHRIHTRNFAEARRFAALAADESNPSAGDANYLLGLMTFGGEGAPKDDKLAFKLHEKAAKQGNGDAMFELYVLMSTGQGTKKDEAAALKWNKKAAELGQNRACYNMGAFHATGRGVKQDPAASVMWYERSAAAGNGQAAATLAAMTLTEKGPDGVDEAVTYIAQAIALDYDVAELLVKVGLPPALVTKLVAAAAAL